MCSCGTSAIKPSTGLLICLCLGMHPLTLYLCTAHDIHPTVHLVSSCACLLCRLFNELIENIYQWDTEEDVEALVNLLASYSQERFLVCSLTEVHMRLLNCNA